MLSFLRKRLRDLDTATSITPLIEAISLVVKLMLRKAHNFKSLEVSFGNDFKSSR
jgi:hypothetical protein